MYSKEEYNEEPVSYCGSCASLRIINMPCGNKSDNSDIDCYCGDCGSTNIMLSESGGIERVLKLQKDLKTFKKLL